MEDGFHEIDRAYNVFDDLMGYEDHTERFENVFTAKPQPR